MLNFSIRDRPKLNGNTTTYYYSTPMAALKMRVANTAGIGKKVPNVRRGVIQSGGNAPQILKHKSFRGKTVSVRGNSKWESGCSIV